MRFRDPQPLLRAVKMDGPNCLLMSLHIQSITRAREHAGKEPSDEHYVAAAESMSDLTSLFINVEHAREMLSYFPHERGYIAEEIEVEGIDDTEGRSTLADVVSSFLTGCRWPRNGDNVDPDEWEELLVEAGMRLGFTRLIEPV